MVHQSLKSPPAWRVMESKVSETSAENTNLKRKGAGIAGTLLSL